MIARKHARIMRFSRANVTIEKRMLGVFLCQNMCMIWRNVTIQ